MGSPGASIHECDVLVVGGGLAGCWAAIRAKDFADRVLLVDKSKVSRSGASTFAAGTMLCPLPEDDLGPWLKEIVEGGEYLNDQEWVELMLREQVDRIQDLQSWGAPFEKDERGNLVRAAGRGETACRDLVFHGKKFMELMRNQVLQRAIPVVERVMITHLLTADGKYPTRSRIVGALGFNTRSGEPNIFKARAVVVATGATAYKNYYYCYNLTGDGVAQGFRAGAEVTNMEFHVGYNWCFERKYLVCGLNLWQGSGMIIINAQGERFMTKYFPELKEKANADHIRLAFAKEGLEGRGPVYSDMTHLSPETIEQFRRALPIPMRALDRAGVDFRKQKWVFDLPSSLCSGLSTGLSTNLYCETNLPGLYATGRAGGNLGTAIVGGGPLALCCVGGYRAGEYASKYALDSPPVEIDHEQVWSLQREVFMPLQVKGGITADGLGEKLEALTTPAGVSLFRHASRLKKALAALGDLKELLPQVAASDFHELVKASEVKSYTLCLELALRAMVERQESRGGHLREDFPYRDDINWLKWVVMRQNDDGIAVRRVPIPMYRYPVKPPRYEKVSSLVPIPKIET